MTNAQYTMHKPTAGSETSVKHRIAVYSINKWSQMTGLLMSDDGLKGFTESLKILDTTLDLATLVSPL